MDGELEEVDGNGVGNDVEFEFWSDSSSPVVGRGEGNGDVVGRGEGNGVGNDVAIIVVEALLSSQNEYEYTAMTAI